ncbi:DegV family protein [Thermoactinomyces mirandus]|uniref:DegV family protein n=1 Tax=Thermoactinomyces mirandus TaxID=2756294 RepID=A0A7W2ARP1_9BACL|nr:DegV family protein [Thermoactinomyces mirandus]MBA4602828.1 DegV family protein [Thermoactinomyces mirandus]
MKIALVTDSTCDLPHELTGQFNIHVVPLRIIYSNGEYRDGIDITTEQIMDRLDEEIPKTSMPSLEDINNLYRNLQNEGYTHCIVLTLSASLSGTHNAFRLCAQDFPGMRIDVIDSKGVSWMLGFLVLEAARLIREKTDYQEILSIISQIKGKIKAYFILDTLEYVQAGGRIGKVAKSLGSMLNLKPIITFDENGKLHPHTIARGKQQALKKLISPIYQQIASTRARIGILHSRAEKEAEALKRRLKDLENVVQLYIGSIGPTLSVHAGPGLLGMVVYPLD